MRRLLSCQSQMCRRSVIPVALLPSLRCRSTAGWDGGRVADAERPTERLLAMPASQPSAAPRRSHSPHPVDAALAAPCRCRRCPLRLALPNVPGRRGGPFPANERGSPFSPGSGDDHL